MKNSLTREHILNLNPKRLREMTKKGMTQREIAKVCGVGPVLIFNRLREYGIKKVDK